MLVHQKASRGNEKLERGVAGHLPASTTIDHWHWATQLNQAHAVRFGVEHLRSLTPHNTGTILWQLNDDWPVVSWAAVDFDEHRKPLWFAVRDAYAPRLATIQPRSSRHAIDTAVDGIPPEKDVLALVVVNDTADAFSGVFTTARTAFDGTMLACAPIEVTVAPRGEATVTIPAEVAAFGDAAAELIVVTGGEESGFASAFFNGAEVVDQKLESAPLTATAARAAGGYTVTVTAHSYVRDVFLQVDRVDPRATVDTGLVTLRAGQSATFAITSDADAIPEAFLDPLVLRSANQLLAS
jgi:beta-mannosidase